MTELLDMTKVNFDLTVNRGSHENKEGSVHPTQKPGSSHRVVP
jgi:hypothetical protein